MMTEHTKPPLWQVMHTAHNKVADPFGCAMRAAYAAEIVALTDTILPEELEPPCGERKPWPQAYQQMSDAKWEQRQQLRQLLLDEAAKALVDG